jgi:transposase InsO family protein
MSVDVALLRTNATADRVVGESDWFRVDMDSHADTCCVGKGVLIVNTTERTARVTPFLKSLGSVCKVPIVTAAIAYDDPKSGEVFILLIHQALHFEEMPNCLLCPMQLRLNDVELNERPKFLTGKPTEKDHALVLDELVIPLSLHGVTSYFHGRKPTAKEYEQCQRYELTYPNPDWQPHDETYAEEEDLRTNIDGTIRTIAAIFDEEQFGNDLCQVFALSSDNPRYKLTPEQLAKTWNVGRTVAEKTLKATTQRAVRTVASPTVERRWPSGDRPLRYKRLHHNVYHDTMKANVKSLRGNKCCEIYATDFGWSRAFPLEKESNVHESLDLFLSRYGIPEALVSDNARAYLGGNFKKKAKEAGIFCKLTDPYSPWQNRAEGEIREIKRLAGRWMVRTKSPRRLWDHTIELSCLVRSHMALDLIKLNGQVPETVMMGQTADISFICEHEWYAWVYFNDKDRAQFPEEKVVLGRYLGPTEPEIGSVLTVKILTITGEVVRRNSVRRLTDEELCSDANKKERALFDEAVGHRLGEPFKESDLVTSFDVSVVTPDYEVYNDDDTTLEPVPEVDDIVGSSGYDPEGYNGYITAQVLLPKGEEFRVGTVIKRKVDDNGQPLGISHDNPILDTRTYDVQFADGDVLEYAANVIAENLYSTVDHDGNRHVTMDSIVDHKSTNQALSKADAFVEIQGKRVRRMTTKGWKLCVQWKDGSTSWESLKDLKESNPVQIAEYAMANGIDTEPAFAWWVPYTLKKKMRIIAKIKTRYLLRTHKFGIELQKSVKDALEIDRRTNTTFWRDAINLEIKNVDVAFSDLDDNERIPVGYQQIRCHMIFDIKVGSLKRKARYVAGGHTTDAPTAMTYASVVSRESVRIGLLIAALNNLSILAADIQNAYLTSPCDEKIYTVLGPEFGPHRQGKRSVIVRALYGLKSAGASFRNHLASCIGHLGYESSKGDPDVWYKPATKVTGEKHYEYLLVYTDDILAIGTNPKDILTRLNKYFTLKPDSIHPPDDYLGTKLKETVLPNGAKAWGQSSSHYIQTAVGNLETWMKEHQYKLPRKAPTPMVASYRPEVDVSEELDAGLANYYQSLIGVLRWIIEIGRLDIETEVSMLATHMAMPRLGHLYAVFRVFAYLKAKHNARRIFDPTYPKIFHDKFKANEDWKTQYGDIEEAIPPNAPEPRGKPVVIRYFVDSDHAGNLVTRRSRTGYIGMLNMGIIQSYSKKQGSVEGATFGSEFVAAKTATEANRALRYKLRMMGVPIDGPSYMFIDNKSVVHNTSSPTSMLKKKSNSIAYHFVREAVAMGEVLIGWIKSEDNIADVMTKVLSNGEKRDALIQKMLWDIT